MWRSKFLFFHAFWEGYELLIGDYMRFFMRTFLSREYIHELALKKQK
jgi:hypothetical protein